MICWVSEYPVSGMVESGKTPKLGRKQADAQGGRRHAVALADLELVEYPARASMPWLSVPLQDTLPFTS